jgi:hypothetical protein
MEWSLRALAQEFDTQRDLFPPFACVADELALEFEECLRNLGEDNLAKAAGILELDRTLAAMSGPSNGELWTEVALRQAPEWRKVRHLARCALNEMGWSAAPPPHVRATYVGPDG